MPYRTYFTQQWPVMPWFEKACAVVVWVAVVGYLVCLFSGRPTLATVVLTVGIVAYVAYVVPRLWRQYRRPRP
jgi:hypothetical protein